LINILRIADSGNGLAHAEVAGYDAGDYIHLVIAGNSYHYVRFLDAGLLKKTGIGRIALQNLHIHILQTGTGPRILVYDGNIVIGMKLAGYEKAHLASSGDKNTHIISSIIQV
jgi:hypothetical protein